MNRALIIAIVIVLLSACRDRVDREIKETIDENIVSLQVPDMTIDLSKLSYDKKTSIWRLNESPFSGYAVQYYTDGRLLQKFGILDGKKQNEAKEWYPDGHIKLLASYHKGKLHGPKNVWSDEAEHRLISEFNYHLAKAHGTQKKWYSTGEIYQILQLNMGKEEGIQQAFRRNGVLYANYEAKAGRTFGLRKASLCFELNNELVQ